MRHLQDVDMRSAGGYAAWYVVLLTGTYIALHYVTAGSLAGGSDPRFYLTIAAFCGALIVALACDAVPRRAR